LIHQTQTKQTDDTAPAFFWQEAAESNSIYVFTVTRDDTQKKKLKKIEN